MASNGGTEMVSYTPTAQSEKLGGGAAPVKTMSPSDLEPTTMIERFSHAVAR